MHYKNYSNSDYHNFYNSCINGVLIDKFYLPVKDQLFKIIKHYNNGNYFLVGYFKNHINCNETDFTRDLLRVFEVIIENNAYDNLDEYVNFLLSIKPLPKDFSDFYSDFCRKHTFFGRE